MNPLKLSVFFIIAAILLIGCWFVFRSDIKPITSAQNPNSFWNNPNNPLSNLSIESIKNFFTKNPASTSSTDLSDQNLTQALTKDMASKILGASGDLLNYKTGQNLSSDQQQISDAALKDINTKDYLPLNQAIDEKILKINYSNAPSIKKEYLQNLRDIAINCFAQVNDSATQALSNAFERKDGTLAKNFSDAYACSYDKLLTTPAPYAWLSSHKDLLTYYQNAKIIYGAIGNIQSDPLKAYLAFNAINQLLKTGLDIQTIINLKAKSVGL
ncbi:MAG: hypothetical protein WC297_02360 [Candidatus Paceibacterota bacterium]|jgi:hypothetical protein